MSDASPELKSKSDSASFSTRILADYRRLLWLLGGANSKVLTDCPRHDQIRFDLLGAINLMLALVVAFTFFRWSSVSLPEGDLTTISSTNAVRSLGPTNYSQQRPTNALALSQTNAAAQNPIVSSDSDQRQAIIAPIVAGIAFLLTLVCLSAANRLFAMRDLSPTTGISIIIQLPIVIATVAALMSHFRVTPRWEFYSVVSLFAWGLFSGEYVKRFWKSPDYDAALAANQYPPGAKERPRTSSSGPASAPSNVQPKDLSALEQQLSKAFERDPKDPLAGLRLADLKRRLGKFDEAAGLLDALINSHPRNVDLLKARAELYKETGDDARARRTLDRVDEILARAAFEDNVGKQISLRSLEMRDVDFFGSFKWEFQPNVAVLLGRNGYGKSFLLRALVAMLQNDQQVTEKFFKNSRSAPFIRVDITKDGKPDYCRRSLLVFDHDFGKVPVLAIPDIRYVDKSGDTLGLTRDEMTDLRGQSAWHFLHEQPYQGMIVKLLYGLCLDHRDAEDASHPFDQPIFRLMQDTIFRLTGAKFEFHEVIRREHEFQLNVLTEGNNTPLPLQKASQGTLSVLTMFGIVYRYLRAIHGDSVPDDKLLDQNGLVVIDEIDAHLHPSWQQKILQLFRNTFRNVQFIVTAHSPLVVAGCKKHEVAVLRKTTDGFRVDVLPDHFIGATSDEIFRKVFQIEDRDQTYLSLNTLSPQRPALEKKVDALQKKPESQLSHAEQAELTELKDKLFYLRQFEELRETRRKSEHSEEERRSLQLNLTRSFGEIAALKKELGRFQNPEANAQWNTLVTSASQIELPGEADRGLLQALAKALALSGRGQDSVHLLEILSRSDPKDLDTLKQLAIGYQAVEQYAEALRTVEAASLIAPADSDLQQVRADLVQILRPNQTAAKT